MNNAFPLESRRAFLGRFLKTPLLPAAICACCQGASAAGARLVRLNDFAIAGFRYYEGARELPRLTPGRRLTLRPEPANRFDRFAIEILHGPAKLGYVPRACNQHLSRLLEAGVPLVCQVVRTDPQAPPWQAVAVVVSLVQATA